MSTPSQVPEEIQLAVENFIRQIDTRKPVVMRDWLFAIGSIAGVLFKSAPLTEEESRDAMNYIASVAYHIYKSIPDQNITNLQ